MDTNDLRRIFQITAAVSVVVTLASIPVDMVWAFRYGVVSALSLANWVALAVTLKGFSEKRPIQMAVGVAVKPLLLVLLLVFGKLGGVEITSLLFAVNTFFICVLAYSVFGRFVAQPKTARVRIS